MSTYGQQPPRREREQSLRLSGFSFPFSTSTSMQASSLPSADSRPNTSTPPSNDLFPAATQTPTSPTKLTQRRRHRRNHAICTSHTSSNVISKARNRTSIVPPVPAIPNMFKSASSLTRQQVSGRSMSEVSSCPTLESDSGFTTPEPFSFEFGSDSCCASPEMQPKQLAMLQRSPSTSWLAIEPTPSGDSIASDEHDEDDDDEEFWHCRGIDESTLTSRKPSFATVELDSFGVDIGAWADSIEDFPSAPVWREETKLWAGEHDTYMDLMRHPLMASSWLEE